MRRWAVVSLLLLDGGSFVSAIQVGSVREHLTFCTTWSWKGLLKARPVLLSLLLGRLFQLVQNAAGDSSTTGSHAIANTQIARDCFREFAIAGTLGPLSRYHRRPRLPTLFI